MPSPTRFGDYAFTGGWTTGEGGRVPTYTGSNPKANLFYNYGADPAQLDAFFGTSGAGGNPGLANFANMFKSGSVGSGTAGGGPSGNSITAPATAGARGFTGELKNLWDTTDYGKDLFSEFDAPSWNDPAYRKELAARSQYYSDVTQPMLRDLAGQLSRAGAIRGGYGIQGAGGPSDALLAMIKAIAGNRQSLISNIAGGLSSEREANRSSAQRGFEDLLGGRQAAQSGYTSAAGSQANAAAQDRANAIAQAQLALQWYNATKNQPSPVEDMIRENSARLAFEQQRTGAESQDLMDWLKQQGFLSYIAQPWGSFDPGGSAGYANQLAALQALGMKQPYGA